MSLQPGAINHGSSARASVPLSADGALGQTAAPVQMAIKTELGVFLFQDK